MEVTSPRRAFLSCNREPLRGHDSSQDLAATMVVDATRQGRARERGPGARAQSVDTFASRQEAYGDIILGYGARSRQVHSLSSYCP